MTTATITFKDDGANALEINIDFGEGGIQEKSLAHMVAAKAYVDVTTMLKETEDESSE